MLERLSDLIRARVSWRPNEEVKDGGEAAPSGSTGDGGFRAGPELMSIVGCSGDEFASILRSLGFRLERKKLEPGESAAKPAETATAEAATEAEKPKAQDAAAEETPAEAAPAEEAKSSSDAAPAEPEKPEFDEIWRPGRRKEPHRPARSGTKRNEHGKEQSKEPVKTGQRQPRRNQNQGQNQGKGKVQSQRQAQEHAERRKAKRAREEAAAENSPFAALKDLRKSLAARGRPEQS